MKRSRAMTVVGLCIGLPLLYALSTGPLVFLRSTGRLDLSDRSFECLYHPLIVAEHHIPPFAAAMHFYVECWKSDSPDQRGNR
jgi:hypothetical protein